VCVEAAVVSRVGSDGRSSKKYSQLSSSSWRVSWP